MRDMRAMRRLIHAASSFELVACGILHAASIATAQAEEDRQYNPWRMGKEKIEPGVVLDHSVREPLENAAQHDCRIFISQPRVYAHIQDTFWPMRIAKTEENEAEEKSTALMLLVQARGTPMRAAAALAA